ncbi:MAG: metallophosphoesterase [Phycisphaerae bacterium]|nr:metallophosphoesterase [Phycisphaerae bacterium]
MFITVFLIIFAILNFYILARLTILLKFKFGPLFLVIFILLTLSYVGAAILDGLFANRITAFIYFLASLWVGTGFILLSLLVLFELVNIFTKFPRPVAGYFIVAIAALLTAYAFLNTFSLKINNIVIDAPVNLRIVVVSDIHLRKFGTRQLEKIVDKVNSLKPDLIFLTGDIFDARHALNEKNLSVLDDLKAPAYFVTGNHERYIGQRFVFEKLKKTKIHILDNETVMAGDMQIIGLDDSVELHHFEKVLSLLPVAPDKYSILLYHRPRGLEDAAKAGINLMLSGHTHNGQIFPFNFIVGTQFKYIKGLYKNDGCTLYVTTGTGTWGPKMRLGSKNEIAVIDLKKSD